MNFGSCNGWNSREIPSIDRDTEELSEELNENIEKTSYGLRKGFPIDKKEVF